MAYFVASKILSFLTNPFFWVFVLLIWALVSRKWRRRALILVTAIVAFMGNTYITNFFIHQWEKGTFITMDKIADLENLVILGGYNNWNDYTMGQDCNGSGDRLFNVMPLMEDSQKTIIISGGSGKLIPEAIKEADITRMYLEKYQHFSAQVLYENQSKNTLENISNSSALVDSFQLSAPAVISSAMHIRRVRKIIRKAGLDWEAYGVETAENMSPRFYDFIVPRAENIGKWHALIHEWIGYLIN